jgi:hypothetical protein
MINKKKKEKVIAEEKTECACPMIDAIAMITARDFDESGVFDPDSPHTVLICDIIFKLYLKGEYKVAMEVLAASFMLAEMETSGELLSVAAAGYTDEKGKFYLDRFFEYSDIYETYEIGKQLFADTEDDDGEDDSDM